MIARIGRFGVLVVLLGVVSTASAATLAAPATLRGNLLVRHARLIDGTARAVRDDAAILVRDGRIAAIGADGEIAIRADARDVPELDVAGDTVLPGLIDALRIEHDVGTVEIGKRADLVVVRGDPLTDVQALRAIQWTIKGGIANTPQGWMDPS